MLRIFVFATVVAIAALLIVGGFRAQITDAQSGDSVPPKISEVKTVDVTETAAKITWKTDEVADSMINFSINKNYGIERLPNPDKTTHEIVIDELEPSTTYHFRIVSADAAGNQGVSSDFVITTKGTQKLKNIETVREPEQRAISEKVAALLEKIEDPAALELLLEKLNEQAAGVTSELTIIGAPEVEPDVTAAIVRWATDRPSDSTVVFSPESQYSEGDYVYSQNSTDGDTINHVVEIIGLEPATVYHFQVQSKDSLGILGKSEDRTFTTKALKPNIINLRLLKVEETAATLTWQTTAPAKTIVEYQDVATRKQFSKGSPTLTTEHTLKLDDLKLGNRYRAVVVAENETGDKDISEPLDFVTVKDEFPPLISKMANESTLFPGSEARIQTIISWLTDEPARCVLNYREGLAPGGKEASFPPLDDHEVEKHVQVITDFTPSTVYKFWVVCNDSSSNESRSEDFVMFTPEKEKSIIDVILENFEGTFGWVKDIGK